jgi:hypothetical protein
MIATVMEFAGAVGVGYVSLPSPSPLLMLKSFQSSRCRHDSKQNPQHESFRSRTNHLDARNDLRTRLILTISYLGDSHWSPCINHSLHHWWRYWCWNRCSWIIRCQLGLEWCFPGLCCMGYCALYRRCLRCDYFLSHQIRCDEAQEPSPSCLHYGSSLLCHHEWNSD